MESDSISKGLRYDTGKIRFDLIPPEAEEALAKVLEVGAKKYAERNWELGMDWMKCYASLRRHMHEWHKGNNTDEETGLPHLALALTNIAFLITYTERNIGTDNRPKIS